MARRWSASRRAWLRSETLADMGCPRPPGPGSEAVGPAEDLAHHGLEVLERLGRVVRVEADLVPVVGESLGQPVPGLALILAAGLGVHVEVLVVVAPLEVLVGPDHLEHLV